MRKFVKQVEEIALGVKVFKGVKPDQQLVKVVNDQLIELMGGKQEELVKPSKGPQVRPLQRFTALRGELSVPVVHKHGLVII